MWKSLTADDWEKVGKPTWVRMPDGKEFTIKAKHEILVKAANWLNEQGMLQDKENLLKQHSLIEEEGNKKEKYNYKPIEGTSLHVKVSINYEGTHSGTTKLMKMMGQNPAGISIAE